METIKKINRIDTGATLLDIYYNWYKSNHNGLPPKINGTDMKAAKDIASYIVQVLKSFHSDYDQKSISDFMSYILAHWKEQPFNVQPYDKLTQISYNMSKIIDTLMKKHKRQQNESAFEKINKL